MKQYLFLAAMMTTVFLGAGAAFADNGGGGAEGNSAPLPIAALGLPIALGLYAFATKRKNI